MKTQINKKQKELSQLLVFAAIVIGLPAIGMVKLGRGSEPQPVVEASPVEMQVQSTMIQVREDSLLQLLHRFAARHSSTASTKSSNDVLYVHMDRLGSNASIFYSSNNSLLQGQDENFEIKVTQTQEIYARFMRKAVGGIFYVKVPTDVLFGILK